MLEPTPGEHKVLVASGPFKHTHTRARLP
eukprot:COSAG01_NODE_56338_length_319_cov_0.677273_1_plen_28_part_01